MPASLLHLRPGQNFKITGSEELYTAIENIKGGGSCQCQLYANATLASKYELANSIRDTIKSRDDVPSYMMAFNRKMHVFPPTDQKIMICGFDGIGKRERGSG